MKFLIPLTILMGASSLQPSMATEEGSLLSSQLKNDIGYGAILLMLLLFVIVMLVLLRTFKVLARVLLKTQGYTEEAMAAALKPAKQESVKRPKGEVWNKLLSLKPLSEEKSLLMDHEFDGIQELDNPTPKWFMALFYATITFAVCYLLIYHVFDLAPLQYQEYKNEMAQAAIEKQLYLSKAANKVDENTVKLTKDPSVLADGHAVFQQRCSPCHGDHAQGVIGPNLTDDYWLHGGQISQVFTTIKYGVPSKGMPTWESQLTPKQIADVANYVKSLQGTNPANPKAPQGIKETDGNKAVSKPATHKRLTADNE